MIRRTAVEIVANPYPGPFSEITDFRYETGLMLLRFRNAVQVRDGEDADYVVGAEYRVSFKVDGRPFEVVVPPGLLTDLVSVHWIARWLVSRVGPYLEAAIVHDYLYVAWQSIDGQGARPEDRRFADTVMAGAMKEAQVSWLRRVLIYGATRVFGNATYTTRKPDRYVSLDTEDVIAQFPNGGGRSRIA